MSKSLLLLQMMDLLQDRPGLSICQIATELGRSERTIYRYLESMSTELHLPVYCEKGGYYLSERPVTSKLDLAPKEVLAVRLALTSGMLNRPGPLGAHAISAWKKIACALNEDTLDSVKDAMQKHAVHVPIYSEGNSESNTMECVTNAVERSKQLLIVYRSQQSGETKPLIIDPYALVFRRHNWYLLAHSKTHEKIVQLKMVRIMKAEPTGESFHIPQDFSVDSFYARSWEMWTGGEEKLVKVKFSPKVAPIIWESKRHPTQHLEETPDGGVILSAKVTGIEEIGFWILSWGSNAEVLEPQELRSSIERSVCEMMETYTGLPWIEPDCAIIREMSESHELEQMS